MTPIREPREVSGGEIVSSRAKRGICGVWVAREL
jgi:hypothetical protein